MRSVRSEGNDARHRLVVRDDIGYTRDGDEVLGSEIDGGIGDVVRLGVLLGSGAGGDCSERSDHERSEHDVAFHGDPGSTSSGVASVE